MTNYLIPSSPRSSLAVICPPPWHFVGEVIWIECRAASQAVRAWLPAGAEITTSDSALAGVMFADWQFADGSLEELKFPTTSQFRECMIGVQCVVDGEPYFRVLLAWVDSWQSMVRGLVQGFPKRLGTVGMTRRAPMGPIPLDLAPGTTYYAEASEARHMSMRASIELTKSAGELPALMRLPLLHTRMWPAWVPGAASLNEHVVSRTTNTESAEIWVGNTALEFTHPTSSEIQTLELECSGGGARFLFAETLLGGALVPTARTSHS